MAFSRLARACLILFLIGATSPAWAANVCRAPSELLKVVEESASLSVAADLKGGRVDRFMAVLNKIPPPAGQYADRVLIVYKRGSSRVLIALYIKNCRADMTTVPTRAFRLYWPKISLKAQAI